MAWLQRETWALVLVNHSQNGQRKPTAFHRPLFLLDLLWAWIWNRIKKKKKKKHSLISTDLLPFSPYDPYRALQKRRDGNAKWKYWIELLSPSTRHHNIFLTDSPRSVKQANKKGDKYWQNTRESGPGGKIVTSSLNILKIQSPAPPNRSPASAKESWEN